MADPALETVDLLLDSMASMVGEDGMEHQFNASGDQSRLHGLYVTVYFSRRKLIAAALHIRSAGAAYLRDLSVSDIMSMLSDFAKRHYPLCSVGVPFGAKATSYLPPCDAATRLRLAEALRASAVFAAPKVTVLFPLVTIRVEADFSAAAVFLRAPAGLTQEFNPPPRELAPETFPPLVDPRMRVERPVSWLGLRAANRASGAKCARAVLGALALTPSLAYRHMFSGRSVWGGHCVIDRSFSISFGDSLTPPIAQDIVIGARDHEWLAVLAELLVSEERSARRQLSALQYYYRAWSLGPPERFPLLCMALEALFGEDGRATAAVLAGVDAAIGPLETGRLQLLMKIRASVIHGGAPDVYESSKYGQYYRRYGEDPIRDMGLVVAACLRQVIFGHALQEHEEPHQDIIAEAQATGRIPVERTYDAVLERTHEHMGAGRG